MLSLWGRQPSPNLSSRNSPETGSSSHRSNPSPHALGLSKTSPFGACLCARAFSTYLRRRLQRMHRAAAVVPRVHFLARFFAIVIISYHFGLLVGIVYDLYFECFSIDLGMSRDSLLYKIVKRNIRIIYSPVFIFLELPD